jgi:hypothetical protein
MPSQNRRDTPRSTLLFAMLAISILSILSSIGERPALAQPSGCHIDPSGVLVCEGTQVATAVPTRAATVPPGTRPPTQPRPTQPPPTPTLEGYLSFWKYCIANAGAPTGYFHLFLVCPPQGSGNCQVARTLVASNCNVPPSGITVKPLPCPGVGVTIASIGCVIGWARRAQADIPPVPITYKPYPRGIVTDRIEFTAPGLLVQDWSCTAPAVDNWSPTSWSYDEDYRNLVFCLRWRQVRRPDPAPDPAPAWIRYVWDERAWGQPPEDASQQQVTEHTYVTSSARKPETGTGNLPAYQVQAHSYWVIDWRESWEHAIHIRECQWTGNSRDECDGDSKYAARTRIEWQPGSDEGTADLRKYGAVHFYADSTLLRTPDGRTMNVLPVPVIEVQGVIGNP